MPKICSRRSVKKIERLGGYEGKDESRDVGLSEIAAIGSDVLAAYPVVRFVLLADIGVMSVRR